jgi:hypothetical protein
MAVRCGTAVSPSAPFVKSRFTKKRRTTSPNPMVAMARKTPFSRRTGSPSGTATSAGSRVATARFSANGARVWKVRMADA